MPDFIIHVPDWIFKSSLRARNWLIESFDSAVGRGSIDIRPLDKTLIQHAIDELSQSNYATSWDVAKDLKEVFSK